MSPEFWGRGLMTEAAEAAISWRRTKGAIELEALIESENTLAIALAERLGMQPTDQFLEGARRYRMSL